jgi:hypothetical protein
MPPPKCARGHHFATGGRDIANRLTVVCRIRFGQLVIRRDQRRSVWLRWGGHPAPTADGGPAPGGCNRIAQEYPTRKAPGPDSPVTGILPGRRRPEERRLAPSQRGRQKCRWRHAKPIDPFRFRCVASFQRLAGPGCRDSQTTRL